MGANSMGNRWLVMGVVALLLLLAFHVRIGVAADAVAVLRTAGMTCGSCSETIGRTLREHAGVAAAEVDLEGGRVIVAYDAKAVGPEALAERVSSAGFASSLQQVLTPEQFRKGTGRDVGQGTAGAAGCCGVTGGGCGAVRQ